MRIVDAQVHIWSGGKPGNANHRQVEAYTADERLKEMDAAGVDGAVIHPPTSWDPNANTLAMEGARQHPARDITRMKCWWRQCVTMFTEELPWLEGRDLELVMGGAVTDWLGWKAPAR